MTKDRTSATRERDPQKFAPALATVLDAPEREQYLPSEQLVAMLEVQGEFTSSCEPG